MATRDIAPQANNEGSIGTAAKKWANVQSVLTNDLTLAKQSTGFTIAGGTTSKTLTVDETAALSAKANLTSPALVTPNLGTPSAGVLTACTTATAADNTATTALASTAFAKSQDAVLARLPNQAIHLVAGAVAAIKNLHSLVFSNTTNSFIIGGEFGLPSWTPAANQTLRNKWAANVGYKLEVVATSGAFVLYLNATVYTSAVPGGGATSNLVAGTKHNIIAVPIVGATTTTVSFYLDGFLLSTTAAQNNVDVTTTGDMYTGGTSAAMFAMDVYDTYDYNRALTAAEVLDLYRNGISYADKWGAQTAITSGTLVVGYKYRINTYVSDDDFTNIGGTNVTGNEFIATGTTPTHWAHSSSLVKTGATLALEPEGIQNNLWYDSSSNNLNASYPATGWSLTRKLNVPRVNTAQPAFLVVPAADQTDIAVGSDVTIVWGTEIFDQGGNFTSNTFTAPVTGKYLLTVFIELNEVDSASAYYYAAIVTSNRTFRNIFSVDTYSKDATYFTMPLLGVFDMDVGDTAYVTTKQQSGTQQTDIRTYSWFSGSLIC
jgi:hypothetical protein